MSKTTNAAKYTTGMAGEFLVAGELLRRGIMAAVTYGSAKKADVVVFQDGRSVPLEVKTTSNARWVLGGQLPRTSERVWVLVFLPSDLTQGPEYHVLTGQELRAAVLPRHDAYMNRYLTKHGKKYSARGVVTVRRDEIHGKHAGAWDKVLHALSAP